MIDRSTTTSWLVALGVMVIGCSGKVVASAPPPPSHEAGIDSAGPVHDAGAAIKRDAAADADASVKPGCDPSGIGGEVTCCGDKLCRGFCGLHDNCFCGDEIDDPGCPEGTVCCEDHPGSSSGLCTSEAVCNGTFDPESEKLVDGGPDGAWNGNLAVISQCNGEPCQGRCVLDPQGHEHCSCWGIDGGCPDGLICCQAGGPWGFLGCGTHCGIIGPQ